jgi:2-polyprenyl-3-methyl-5-hydroxy-6-metoxy-1,4-benzoquinol methylase
MAAFPSLPHNVSSEGIDVQRLYHNRFEKKEATKIEIWKILCKHFFQRFVSKKTAIVLDIAAGNCEFINHIEAHKKIAIDANPDIVEYANKDVKVIHDSFFNIKNHLQDSCDIIFASNIFEHLDTKEQVINAVKLCYDQLFAGGKLLILQPNIKYVKGAYWDFIDHKVPLTDKSLIEAGLLCGFKVEYTLAKFLPYTTQSRFPQHPLLVRCYLKLPFVWALFGKQSFLVLVKPA